MNPSSGLQSSRQGPLSAAFTFESLAREGQVHAQLSRQAGQEVGRPNVCEQADPTLRHCKHGPAQKVTSKTYG